MLVAGHRQQTTEQGLAEWFAARAKEGGEAVWAAYEETKKAFGNQPIGGAKVPERQQLEDYLAGKDNIEFWNKFLDNEDNGSQPEVRNAVAFQYVAQMDKLHQKYYGTPLSESIDITPTATPEPAPPAAVEPPQEETMPGPVQQPGSGNFTEY